MKKQITYLFLTVFSVIAFALTSCSKDNDNIIDDDIVGTWKNITFGDDLSEIVGTQYMQFSENGAYTEVNIYSNETEILKGKWEKNGNKISVYGNDIESIPTEIIHLTESELKLLAAGITLSYKRVPDSEIEEYIK